MWNEHMEHMEGKAGRGESLVRRQTPPPATCGKTWGFEKKEKGGEKTLKQSVCIESPFKSDERKFLKEIHLKTD